MHDSLSIVIGADHRGFEYKEHIKRTLNNISWVDVGAFDAKRSDYPIFSHNACRVILSGESNHGVLICGSGVGMAVTANRYAGIYAAVVWNVTIARLSRQHDNVNVLVIPSDFVTKTRAVSMIKAWLRAQFFSGRYQKRLAMIDSWDPQQTL